MELNFGSSGVLILPVALSYEAVPPAAPAAGTEGAAGAGTGVLVMAQLDVLGAIKLAALGAGAPDGAGTPAGCVSDMIVAAICVFVEGKPTNNT